MDNKHKNDIDITNHLDLLPDERIDTVNENLKLIQKKNGLVFGTDAYMLSAYVHSSPKAIVADLGSGTGVAAFLLLVKGKADFVHTYEIQDEFAELIKRNASLNMLEKKIAIHQGDIRKATAVENGGECDIVISNPPYMKVGHGERNIHNSKYIARHEVCGDIGDFCHAAKRLLKHGGSFYCVYRTDRLCDLLYAMRTHSLEPKVMTLIHADIDTEPSMVLVEARKGGGTSLKMTRPLFIYNTTVVGNSSDCSKRTMTADADEVYRTCSFRHMMI